MGLKGTLLGDWWGHYSGTGGKLLEDWWGHHRGIGGDTTEEQVVTLYGDLDITKARNVVCENSYIIME